VLAANSLAIVLLLAPVPSAAAQAPTAWAGGTVVDESGRPVAGARVELLHADDIFLQYRRGGPETRMELLSAGDAESGPRFHAISGADGRFRLAGLPADAWFVLRVLDNGFTVLVQRGIASPVAGGQIALGTLRLPRVPTVHGRVADSRGRPLAGVQVWALSAADLELRGRFMDPQALGGGEAPVAVTDRNGRFAIPRFEPGILEVCGQGLAPARVSPVAARPNRIVLTSPPPSRRLSGRVVDGQGGPVAQAKVHLKAHGRDPWLVLAEERLWHPCPPRLRADPAVPVYDKASSAEEVVALAGRDGSFAFELAGPVEEMEVRAEAAGYLRQESTPVPAPPRFPAKVELVLERGAVVSGRVLTARGLPAAGAEVKISGGRSEEAEPVRTDAAGRYRVPGIEPGPRAVMIQHLSGKELRHLEVAAGSSRQPDLTLDDDSLHEVRGRVSGPDGAGLEEASVVAALVPALHSWNVSVTSGVDGAFRLAFRDSDAAGKALSLDVEKDGFTPRHLRLDPAEVAAADAAPLTVRLDPGSRLTGHILGVEAEGLQEVTVEILQGSDRHRSPVSRDGEFRIAGLAPGELIATASSEGRCGSIRTTLEPGGGETVLDLEIPAGLAARGRVLAPDGTPVADASVEFQSVQESPDCATEASVRADTEEDGTFSTPLQEGRYIVLAHAEGYAPTVQEAPLTVARVPVEGLELRLGPGMALGGRLLGLTPEEILRASVKAVAGPVYRTARLAADGTYRFADLGPGEWSIHAEVRLAEGFRQRNEKVTLERGEAAPPFDLDFAGL
jgi:protocatechuate 3,4-dioxygenase beta subunit